MTSRVEYVIFQCNYNVITIITPLPFPCILLFMNVHSSIVIINMITGDSTDHTHHQYSINYSNNNSDNSSLITAVVLLINIIMNLLESLYYRLINLF